MREMMNCTRLDNETTQKFTKRFNNLVARYVYIVGSLNAKMAGRSSIARKVNAKLSEEPFKALNFHVESYAASKDRTKDTTYVTVAANIMEKILYALSTIDELCGEHEDLQDTKKVITNPIPASKP